MASSASIFRVVKIQNHLEKHVSRHSKKQKQQTHLIVTLYDVKYTFNMLLFDDIIVVAPIWI